MRPRIGLRTIARGRLEALKGRCAVLPARMIAVSCKKSLLILTFLPQSKLTNGNRFIIIKTVRFVENRQTSDLFRVQCRLFARIAGRNKPPFGPTTDKNRIRAARSVCRKKVDKFCTEQPPEEAGCISFGSAGAVRGPPLGLPAPLSVDAGVLASVRPKRRSAADGAACGPAHTPLPLRTPLTARRRAGFFVSALRRGEKSGTAAKIFAAVPL